MGGVLAERLDELRNDRQHGGSWMARRAVEALGEIADQPAESSEDLLARLDSAGRELAGSRRAMGAIAGAVGRVLAAAHHGAHLEPQELRRLVQEEIAGLVAARERAAASIAIQLADALTDATVLTHSASATVREAVVHTPPYRVICTVSSPFEEGRAFSEELRAAGLDVELVDDADADAALERASLLLVGADTVFRDGAVCNKVGTRPLAEAAGRLDVRMVVACEVLKLAPIDAPERIEDEHFDVTPGELVDQVVTEEGAQGSADVGALVDRTPFLAEGYAILRSAQG
jgi:translation initiation factor 2B subunit (eIF-2B alpha/beta/delta family)